MTSGSGTYQTYGIRKRSASTQAKRWVGGGGARELKERGVGRGEQTEAKE
jgi:hypothetical protein